jgi:acylphosphatase
MTSRRRVVVHGRVQGVGFRVACARRAERLSLGGWVRNLADGSVEAVFEGRGEDVDAMVVWCRHGPVMARVTGVEEFDEQLAGEREFRVR